MPGVDDMTVLDCGFFEAVVDTKHFKKVKAFTDEVTILNIERRGGWFKRKTLYLSCCGCKGDAVRILLKNADVPYMEIENGRNHPRIIKEPGSAWLPPRIPRT